MGVHSNELCTTLQLLCHLYALSSWRRAGGETGTKCSSLQRVSSLIFAHQALWESAHEPTEILDNRICGQSEDLRTLSPPLFQSFKLQYLQYLDKEIGEGMGEQLLVLVMSVATIIWF